MPVIRYVQSNLAHAQACVLPGLVICLGLVFHLGLVFCLGHVSCLELVFCLQSVTDDTSHDIKTHFYCPQAFLSLAFQCRDAIFEIRR